MGIRYAGRRREVRHIPVIIAIGANLPWGGATAWQTCEAAARALAGLDGLHRAVRSRWFSSAAIPAGSGERYVNGAVRLEGAPEPHRLLAQLQRIEAGFGRTRPGPNAPRTLDLDIIDLNGLVRAQPDPVLPHPRAHQRAFVLLPLRDLAPGWTHPVTGRSVHDLLAALAPQDIRPV